MATYKKLIDIKKNELKIIVANGEDLTCQIIITMLQELGYQKITTANNGAKAKVILDQQKIDAAIIDIDLSGMDGFSLLKYLRKHDDMRLKHAPILMTSNTADKDLVIKAVKAGADSYILKPFDKKTFKEGFYKALIHRDDLRPLM